jgi:uncharacterized membrane protein HdeD (DUF308 family)
MARTWNEGAEFQRRLSRVWWLFLLRGLAAVIFGILAFVSPDITVVSLVLLFGIYALADGVLGIIAAVGERDTNRRWWVALLEGLISLAAGVIAFIYPSLTAVALLYLIAAWALLTGVLEIIAAIRLRKEIINEWALGFSGLLSVIFGVLLFVSPGTGILALIWVLAAYAILFGILMVVLAFRIKRSVDRAVTA